MWTPNYVGKNNPSCHVPKTRLEQLSSSQIHHGDDGCLGTVHDHQALENCAGGKSWSSDAVVPLAFSHTCLPEIYILITLIVTCHTLSFWLISTTLLDDENYSKPPFVVNSQTVPHVFWTFKLCPFRTFEANRNGISLHRCGRFEATPRVWFWTAPQKSQVNEHFKADGMWTYNEIWVSLKIR